MKLVCLYQTKFRPGVLVSAFQVDAVYVDINYINYSIRALFKKGSMRNKEYTKQGNY